jgi:hypothetical protein
MYCSIIWWTINLAFEMTNILHQNCTNNYSFLMLSSIVLWNINLSFQWAIHSTGIFVTCFTCNVLFHHIMNDKSFSWDEQHTQSKPLLLESFLMCCSIISSTINLPFERWNILDYNSPTNYSFPIYSTLISITINLSFEITNNSMRTLLRSVDLSPALTSNHEG